jgi:anti-sigma regulatory factor (Ser/Thr protein kinase)
MPKAEVTLPAAVSSVPTARHFIESVLAAWDLRAIAWDATLVVSELAANAALHAGGGAFTVRVDSDSADGIRLELQDRSRILPRQRTHSTEATTGRGLRLVESLAVDWGVTPRADGKVVWVLLARPGRSSRLHVVHDEAPDDLDSILAMFGDGDSGSSEAPGPPAPASGLAA